MSRQTPENLIGAFLDDRYRIESSLGQGSMGVVYRARDTVLERNVAIKVVSQLSLGTSGRGRLLQEAQSIAKLNHPNIVTVYDVGEHDSLPFIVMELVDGHSLHEQPPDDLESILAVSQQICAALQHAHSQGIIHRDIKPENVLLDKDGNARLMDFGIARSTASRLTQQGTLIGTIHYIAPEQALGGEIDQRVDLYSLGVMLYEMVTGELPFEAEDPLAVITQHLHAPVVPPRAKDETIPVELDMLIQRLMAKEPTDRPESAAEVLEILEGISANFHPGLDVPVISPAEELSPLERIASGRIVGRSSELVETRRLWQAALSGQGQLLLISGEPGVGKTRLVQELVTQSQLTGGTVLVGASYAEWGPPYDPFRQIVRNILHDSALDLTDLPDQVLGDLVRIAPELQLEFPDLPENLPEDPHAEGARLIDSFLAFFNLLCSRTPVLLVLEDAHWADSSSLILLRHLARNSRKIKLMIVVTYREVELHEAQSLHEVLLDFNREKLGTRIKLSRLNRQETKDFLAILFAERITSEFLDGIYRETEGNPFFIEEVCKALVESSKLVYQDGSWHHPGINELGIPQSIQVAIQSRLRDLSEETQEMLVQAAVIGREFDFETLLLTTRMADNTLIEALDEAVIARLVEETGLEKGGEYYFVHALISGTLVAGLRTLQRRRLHRRAAGALETTHPEAYEALAYQHIEAGQVDTGVTYLLRAGDRARMLYAHPEAIFNYQQALDHLKDEDELDMAARVLMKLGLAYHNSFQYKQARRAYQEGFDLWQQAGEVNSIVPLQPAPHALRGVIGEILSLDPGLNTDGWSAQIIDNIFSGLVELDFNMDVVPDVAHRWEVLEDGYRYLFHLREDVTWSDGEPVTAHDFECAWKRVLNPTNGSGTAEKLFPIKNAKAFHQSRLNDQDAVGIRALDEFILEVELERPANTFLYVLSDAASFPVPRHVLLEHGDKWTDLEKLVTNGPFNLVDLTPGESLRLEVNPRYSGIFHGNLQQIEMSFQNQQSGADLTHYQHDQLDFFWLGQSDEFNRGRFQYPEEFRTAPFLMTFYIGFDTRRSPFDDPRVRRAFAFGIDREHLVNSVYGGVIYPATGGFLPPGMLGHSEDIALPFDPEQARRALAEAGYPGGKGFPKVEFLSSTGPRTSKYVEIVQSQWLQSLGIECTWRILPWNEFLEHLDQQNSHIWGMSEFAEYPDPEAFGSMVSQKTGWVNDEYEQLVKLARDTMEHDKRVSLYKQADRLLVEQVPVLPFAYSRFNALIKPWVRRFPLSPTRGWFWKDVIIEDH